LLFDVFFAVLIDGSIHKKANNIGAGPLMVMLTDVNGSAKSKPEYNFWHRLNSK
jgi:hypothetical protein